MQKNKILNNFNYFHPIKAILVLPKSPLLELSMLELNLSLPVLLISRCSDFKTTINVLKFMQH